MRSNVKNPSPIYCAVVDPFVSSEYLADELLAQHIQTLALLTNPKNTAKLPIRRFNPEKFSKIISIENLSDNEILEKLSMFDPRMIMAGYEQACPTADRLATLLTPSFANPPASSQKRFHKTAMQQALEQKNISIARYKEITIANPIHLPALLEGWSWPIVVKPTEASGTSGVKICHTLEEVETQLVDLLKEKSFISGKYFKVALLQEFLIGEEYFIDACSHQGQHFFSSLVAYKKDIRRGIPIYRYAQYKDFRSEEGRILMDYINHVLNAVELRNGLSHTEIMLTKNGPRLIEVNPRISGIFGSINMLAKKAYHRDQVSLLANMIKYPHEFLTKEEKVSTYYCLARIVLLNCFEPHKIKVFNDQLLKQLNSYYQHFWFQSSGTALSGNLTLCGTVGIVLLCANNQEILDTDTEKIFEYEKNGDLF